MTKPLRPPAAGTPGAPTLTQKEVVDLSVSPDVQRIMGMKADPEGFNPEVNQPITDAAARSYAARIQERVSAKADILKKKKVPLGHVEPPPTEKMEAIAGMSSGEMPRPNFFEPPPPDPTPISTPAPAAQAFSGVGSAYPVNQAFAQGKVDRPMSLKEANQMAKQPSPLSKETVQALEMAAENAKKTKEEAPPSAPPSKPSVAQGAREELNEAEDALPSPVAGLDFGMLAEIRSGLMDPERRAAIEKRLTPAELDIGDMIMKHEVTQTVRVVPGKFEVTLRSFTQAENLWILKYIFDFPGSALYTQELINTCRLCCSLVAINGAYLPDHRKDVGKLTETIIKEDFEKKLFNMVHFPVQLVADMSVQSIWFQDRIDKLFTVDALKNG